MENNPQIPEEMYGKWWKIVNEEFGEIIPGAENKAQGTDGRENETSEEQEVVQTTYKVQANQSRKENSSLTAQRERLSREENYNLTDYLRIGMSVDEARAAFQREVEMAELRQKIRDSKREEGRGSKRNANTTTIGATFSTRGRGRGGLTFN